MTLRLTEEQAMEIRHHMQPGRAILGRIMWKPFDGNVDECGTLLLDYGFIPEQSLPALREAIREANEPQKPRKCREKRKNTSHA